MEVSFLPHAQRRLAERGLKESQVIEIVANPEQFLEEEGVKIAQRRYFDAQAGKDYLIRVFFVEQGETAFILSAYRTSKVEKYWRREDGGRQV